MHQRADVDAIVEQADAATGDQLVVDLIRESNARSKVAVRRMAGDRQAAGILQHARRNRSIGASAVVVGDNPSNQIVGTHIGAGRRYGDLLQLAGPQIR